MARYFLNGCIPFFLLLNFTSSLESIKTLKQVLVVSRHGVRGPYGPHGKTPTPETMSEYSTNGFYFPTKGVEWGTSTNTNSLVEPKLTKHGEKVIHAMGKYFRESLYPSFASDLDCIRDIWAYSDNNQRDNETALQFLTGLLPQCQDQVNYTNADSVPIFNQGEYPTDSCPNPTHKELSGIVGAKTTVRLVDEIHTEIREINDIVECCKPSLCHGETPIGFPCNLFHIPSNFTGRFYAPWEDSLSNAAYLSEWFLLQTLNNLSIPSSSSFEEILHLGRIHLKEIALMTKELSALNFGSTMLAHLTGSMANFISNGHVPTTSSEPNLLLQAPKTKFIYYAGHDVNLLFMRELLELEWHAKGWEANQPSPGSMLIFELHCEGKRCDQSMNYLTAEDYFLKIFFQSASPWQIRNAEDLSIENPPDRQDLTIPGCSESHNGLRCPFPTFLRLMKKKINLDCTNSSFSSFVKSIHAFKRNIDKGKTTFPSVSLE